MAVLIALLIAAVKRRTLAGYAVTTAAVAGISLCQFWSAILCALFCALCLGWQSAAAGWTPS